MVLVCVMFEVIVCVMMWYGWMACVCILCVCRALRVCLRVMVLGFCSMVVLVGCVPRVMVCVCCSPVVVIVVVMMALLKVVESIGSRVNVMCLCYCCLFYICQV